MEQDLATKQDIQDLKDSINKSFREIVRMYLRVQDSQKDVEERLSKFNAKAGHKI
jgi:hypothetical protein